MEIIEESDDVDFDVFARAYLAAIKGRLRSWDQIVLRFRRLDEFFAGRKLKDIQRSDVSRYIALRLAAGLSNGSVNLEISTLSGAYNFASVNWCWTLHNPVTGLHLRQREGRLRYLSPVEIRSLIAVSQGPRKSPHLADFIRLAVNTGCRKNELLKLRWKAVELGKGSIVIEGDNSKNGRRRMIPLNQVALGAIQSRSDFRSHFCPQSPWVFCYKDGRRVTRVDKPFWSALERAGIEDFRIHDLRHTFASWLVTEDVSLYHVKELLGHRSITMTERYAHLANSALRRAVAVLDGL